MAPEDEALDGATPPLPEPDAPPADEPLGDGFPAVSVQEWREQVLAKAKGGEPDFAAHVEAGVDASWLYTQADALAPDPGGLPGQAPFTRGTRLGTAWEIRQECVRPERDRANAELLDELEGGATAVSLRLDRAAREARAPEDFAGARGRDGLSVSTLDDLDEVLRDVLLDLAPVALDAGAAALPAAALLTALWERRGHEPGAARASFRFDPIGTLAGEGRCVALAASGAGVDAGAGVDEGADADADAPGTAADGLSDAAGAAVAAAGAFAAEVHAAFPGSRALAVDTRAYVDAGAEAVTELAVALSTAVAYLRAADQAGLEPADAARQLELSLTIGPDQFLEIAKLRAARRMWARVLEASGVAAPDRHSPIVVRSAARVLAAVDPWVNILRGTTAAFAAAVGGADGLTITPFDAPLGLPSPLGRRVARNTQVVLAEESALARVSDPAGGSWYVEQLTDALAHAAWDRLQELERRGGMPAVLLDGSLAAELAEAAQRRQHEVATRKRTLTGVNSFPLLEDEGLESAEPPDLDALAAAETQRLRPSTPAGRDWKDAPPPAPGERLAKLTAAARDGARLDELQALLTGGAEALTMEPLEARRDAAPFEALRHEAEQRDEPRLFLACLGTLSQHVAVATWAKGFVEAGGIATVTSGPHDDLAGLTARMAEEGLDTALVCGGRKTEPADVQAAVTALREAGARWVGVAGAKPEAAAAAGADAGVKDGVDMIELLSGLLNQVAPA